MSLSQFSSPWWLLFLIVVIGLVVGYVLMQRRRQKHTLLFSNMELLETVAPTRRAAPPGDRSCLRGCLRL